MPLEADVTLKDHNWFWSPTNYKNLRSIDQLMDIYYKSVGRGAVLLLNAAPDTTGLIPQEDMQLYRQFGDEIKRRFGNPIASTASSGDMVELKMQQPTRVDHIILQEDIVFGERVREYVVEGNTPEGWQELAKGTSVGYKRIEQFKAVEVTNIRIRFTRYSYPPVIKNVSAYYVGSHTAGGIATAKSEVLVGTKVIDKNGVFKIDLSDFIKIAGQYDLQVRNQKNDPIKIVSADLVLQGITTPGFTRINLDGNCSINITAHPSGGKGTIVLTGKVHSRENSTHNAVNIFLNKTK
jgi:alpha-L-fucosidase